VLCSLPLSRFSVMESDAAAAVRKYSGKPFKGSRVLIEVAKPRLRDEKEKRQPKSTRHLRLVCILHVCQCVRVHLLDSFPTRSLSLIACVSARAMCC
jgi:hypothetical protein